MSPKPARAWPGPHNIVEHTLPNGVRVLVRANPGTHSVALSANLPVGALCHPPEQAGLAAFTAAMLLRGTQRHSHDEIFETLESLGAQLSFEANMHHSGFSAKALASDLDTVLALAAAALRTPTFPPDQVEQLRSEWLTGLAMQQHDTSYRATDTFYSLAYAGHPYAVNHDGTPASIRALTRQNLADFHQRWFGPHGLTLTIVGAVSPPAVIDLVTRHFGDWANPHQPAPPALPPLAPLTGVARQQVILPGKAQSDIVLGWAGPSRAHPLFLAARLANNILGAFGMGGRLSEVIREKHGLAYYAGSTLNGGLGPGAWYLYAGVEPRHVPAVVDLMRREVERLLARPVSAADLADNQAQFIGLMPLGLESNDGQAETISALAYYNLGLDYLQRYPALIRAITRDQVLAVAREFMRPQAFALAVAGPEG